MLPGQGTLTGLPEVGTVIENAGVIVEVDGRPVIAMYGAVPMWRDLGPSVTDGKDVLQLEYALAALGYAETYDVTVDEDWDGGDDRGRRGVPGGPRPGRRRHRPARRDRRDARRRAGSVGGVLGQDVGGAQIELTAAAQAVHLDVDVADADLVADGTSVQVELPTGVRLDGSVTAIGTAETAEDGSATMPVEVSVAGGVSIPDGMPVTVIVTTVAAEGVLAWCPSRPCWPSPRAATRWRS